MDHGELVGGPEAWCRFTCVENDGLGSVGCGNVGVCGGFENDIDNENCCICDAPRPPMEELMASLKLELKKKAAEEKAAAALNANSDDEEGEPLHHIRLKMLRRDIRHIISHD